MELKYTKEAIKSAIDFGKKNKSGTFKQWFKEYQKLISIEDRMTFENIQVATILVPNTKSKLYLLLWTGVAGGQYFEPFKMFISKYFENYYLFTLDLVNSWGGEMQLLTPNTDLFDIFLYKDNPTIKNLKEFKFDTNNSAINSASVTITNDWTVKEIEDYKIYLRNKKMYNYHFQIEEGWHVYIDKIDKLNFKPAIELLKNIKK